MKINNIEFSPIGYGLGYCFGIDLKTKMKKVYYFKGYPNLKYEDCEPVLVAEADVDTFTSDRIMGEGKDKFHKYFKGKIVKKATGKLLSQDWLFIPGKGIQCDDVSLSFGMRRNEIRMSLGNEQEFNFSRGESEDSYEEFQDTNTWFKLGYDEQNLLKEIEFHEGNLRHDALKIFGRDITEVVNDFASLGYKFYPQQYAEGLLCEELKAAIASSEDMGGDRPECSYFYASSDISHLMEE